MRWTRIAGIALLVSLLAALSGAGNGPRAVEVRRLSAPAPDDATLEGAVMMRISGRPGVTVSDVQVEVLEGALRLSGSVPDLHSRREVERLASSIRGLTSVENAITVARRDVPDSLLALEVRRLVDSYPRLRSRDLQAEVNQGNLILRGEVLLARDRLDAEEASVGVAGILSVRNLITVAPTDVDPELIRRRLSGILGNKLIFGGVDRLRVEVAEGGVVRITGLVMTQADRLRAERLAYGLRGVTRVENGLLVRRTAADPPSD